MKSFARLLSLRMRSVLVGASLVAVPLGWAQAPSALAFGDDIKPLLAKYCYECHGETKKKGDVNLQQFHDEGSIYRQLKLWENVVTQLHDGEMPPDDKPQPSAEERERLVSWIRHALATLDETKIEKNPGYVVTHRLNRAEYNFTIRDLFGVTTNPADKFPTDGGGGGGFDNNADTLFIPPVLMERYLGAATEILESAPAERIFVARPGLFASKRSTARKILAHHALRAFRRPVEPGEVERYLKLYDRGIAEDRSHDDAVRLALKAVLVSPHFLFRTIADRGTDQPFPLDGWELASRLSYFLWSSMPDEELFALAAAGRLTDPAVVRTQVRRMLADPKAEALAENFTLQWLDLRSFKTTAQPDRNRFPQFTPTLAAAMLREPVLFFSSLVQENVSVLELIDSSHTFANAELAQLYGLPAIEGAEFRRVTLPDRTRGGVLSMAAVLTNRSYPLRTSPVLRGKWVLEEILGTPPPPPPPQVKGLPRDEKTTDGMTLRQKLEKHRSEPECASCHSRLDPPGFGLETFDPIGRWRTDIAGAAVDAKGVMPGGRAFDGPAELKSMLLERKEQIVKNLAERMLAYALGRGLEVYDVPAVRKITEALAANDYRLQTLLSEVAVSYPFQYRKAPPQAKTLTQHSP